ncbi:MAG: HAD-IA family hydrolase [Gammaproteobacteria bacterium]|nr:HAD-IA family hydrolase [Gammaproteobacteria bacterium]
MRRGIEAVLWDIGGVLTASPFEAFNQFEAANGLPRDFIRGVNAMNPETNAWAQFESNQVDVDAFDDLFRAETAALGHPVNGKRVLEILSGAPRPRMIEALRSCKRHFRVGAITNNMEPASGSPPAVKDPARAKIMDSAMSLFEVIVESSVERVRKPDPAIYRIACERLGVEAARSVFLDDLGINLKPARAMGMHTIKVLNEDQALAELSEVTGLRFG